MIHQAHYYEMNQRDSIARQPFDKSSILVFNNNLYGNSPLYVCNFTISNQANSPLLNNLNPCGIDFIITCDTSCTCENIHQT